MTAVSNTPPGWQVHLTRTVRQRNDSLAEWCSRWVAPRHPPRAEGGSPLSAAVVACPRCKRRYRGDEGLTLHCGDVDHWHCADCLKIMALDLLQTLKKKCYFGLEEGLLLGMVKCSVCHHPSLLNLEVLEVSMADLMFQGHVFESFGSCSGRNDLLKELERRDFTPFKTLSLPRFTLDIAATNVLTYHVDSIYQNERRSFIGKFGKENLLVTDFRGPWSSENGARMAKGRQGIKCPNQAYHWLEKWTVATRLRRCDTQGWEYAITWPG
eukprot:Sspe_Gene.84053::Locus_55173_Transcript_1_3_Confidence_0.500_Length_851::g.84053::m.84053